MLFYKENICFSKVGDWLSEKFIFLSTTTKIYQKRNFSNRHIKFHFNYLSVRINNIALLCGENASDSDILAPVNKIPATFRSKLPST